MPKNSDSQALIIGSVLLADQLDQLHLSVSFLLDLVKEGEIDVFLESPDKDDAQKALYLSKLVEQVSSPELRSVLQAAVETKDFGFFARLQFEDYLRRLQKAAEKVKIVKLSLAVTFTPKDLREMAALLSERTGRPVALDLTVDKSLIGGAVIQHGNYLSDYSLKSRMEQFSTEWKENQE